MNSSKCDNYCQRINCLETTIYTCLYCIQCSDMIQTALHHCNCRSPDFLILTSPTRNLDRHYICLVIVVVVVCLYAEILQIPPDLPVLAFEDGTRPIYLGPPIFLQILNPL